MSKLGGWHSCYNSDRAISNELGGKWEKFFEETRDESGAVGLEWDVDENGNSINFNGVLVIITQDGVPSQATGTLRINDNERVITLINSATTTTALVTTWLGCKINNGLVDSFGKQRNTLVGTGSLYTGINPIFTDSINYLNIGFTTVPSGANIKVYVLRGV